MYEAARIRRTVAKGGDKHTIFRIGEPHGSLRARRGAGRDVQVIDSVKPTANLWGERWSKLSQNGMRNGVSAVTGLTSPHAIRTPAVRRFSIKLGGESCGSLGGWASSRISAAEADMLALAAEAIATRWRKSRSSDHARDRHPRADISARHAQDVGKGRRTRSVHERLHRGQGQDARHTAAVPREARRPRQRWSAREIKPSPSHLDG